MPTTRHTACRYCRSQRLTQIVSLGPQPPANNFLRAEEIPSEPRYPLDVSVCEECCLVQLVDVVPAEALFDHYLYRSSSSRALVQHYAALAASLSRRFRLRAGDVVVDVGCNDGALLRECTLPGLVRVGVEPSDAAEAAAADGLRVLRAFFAPAITQRIVDDVGPARLVTATNVFAHVDAIDPFVEGIRLLLAEDGALMIEASYLLDVIDQTLFDTIYHEHLCYLSLTPLVPFLARHGLEVFDVERVPFGASGPAIRVFAQRQGGGEPVRPSVTDLLAAETRWGIRSVSRYRDYADRVAQVKAGVLELMEPLRASGKRLGGYGAPAKGNTLLNYFGLTAASLECIADTNPLKQGLVTPGSHIPIVSEEAFLERMPDYALLLSWNYLDFFLQHSAYIRKGGRFIVPLPTPRICP